MLFNPPQVYMPNRHRQPSALRTFFPSSSFSPPDSKEPLRRGILFSSVAAVLMLVGAILTWLGFNDVFGGKISMTGPLLIALALLMLLLSLRQFMLARKRNTSSNAPVQLDALSTGGLSAVVVDHDDGNGAATIVVETWESEEPNNDTFSYRNIHDLAPPSYMDIAQSCSSNCPSFISHEDHNEAPPTYEETCGVYNSQSSLTNSCSRRCSFQNERSPSPHKTYHSGYNCFRNEHTYSEHSEGYSESFLSHRPSDISSPKTPLATNQPSSSQTAVLNTENNPSMSPRLGESQPTRNTAGQCIPEHSSQCTVTDNNAVPCVVNSSNKPSECSRKSFSSIPSYTCLLSESGEVSSQIYDTSTYIEEMIPLLVMNGTARDPPINDHLSHTIIPSRSHSMSSVNANRQGVPYSSNSHTCQTKPEAQPTQFIHDQQPISGILPPSSSSLNTSCTISETLPPTSSNHSTSGVISRILPPRSSNHSTTGAISGTLPPSSSSYSKKSTIPKNTSSSLQDPQLIQGSEPHLLDLLAAQPSQVTGFALLQPLPVGTIPLATSSSQYILNSEETNLQGELEPLLEPSNVQARRRFENRVTTNSSDGSTPTHGKLSKSQDVQETI